VCVWNSTEVVTTKDIQWTIYK